MLFYNFYSRHINFDIFFSLEFMNRALKSSKLPPSTKIKVSPNREIINDDCPFLNVNIYLYIFQLPEQK